MEFNFSNINENVSRECHLDVSSTNTTPLNQHLKPVEYDTSIKVVVGAACIVFLGIGVPTNFLIITSVAVYANVRQISNFFITSLAVKDLMFLLAAVPIFYVDFFQGHYPFGPMMCTAQMILSSSLGLSSLLELMNIALNRFIRICCKHELYRRIYTFHKAGVYCALSWIIGFSVGVFLGTFTAELDPDYGICFLPKSPVKAAIFSIALLATCSVTSFCYYKIFKKVRASHMNIRRFNAGPAKQKFLKNKMDKSLRDFAVFAVYIILLLPFVIINSFGLMTPRSLAWDFAKLFSYLNNVSNCIIYGLLNKQLRRCFSLLLKLNKCRSLRPNSVAPFTISEPSARYNVAVDHGVIRHLATRGNTNVTYLDDTFSRRNNDTKKNQNIIYFHVTPAQADF